jgi:pre-mRNA-processing factor 17
MQGTTLKCVHRFTGHNQGVRRIRLFPITGHLLLSAGLVGKCKVWSIAEKQVTRTYIGHSAAVRDVQFNSVGSRFVSASFDRYLRRWNTGTGEVIQTSTNRRVPYVVKFYPHDDNLFVVGYSNNRIVTYNATTAEITQEYDHHLAPVNAIVFVEDNGTKVITTSDDKKVLVWEWDIDVPIKYISEPSMHSIPCLVIHPSERFFVGQSLDNTIVVFRQVIYLRCTKRKRSLRGILLLDMRVRWLSVLKDNSW